MFKRPETIADILPTLHPGTWFDFSDWANQTHENLIILDDSKTKPTKKFLEDELKKQQDEYEKQAYARSRAEFYDSIPEQLDMQYWDKVNGTNKWQEAVAKVKADNPKPE